MISPESPVLFQVGDFGVRYYSVIMFLAIVFGAMFSLFIAKKYYKNVNIEKFWDILPVVVLSAILGARLYYVMLDFNYYSQNIFEVFAIWHGGLSIHGAILGGFLGGFFYVKKNAIPLWGYADIFSYGLLFGQAIGRLGNYFNVEAFGGPCYFSKWVCMYVQPSKRPSEYWNIEYFHPAFLYEGVWNIFILIVLIFLTKRFERRVEGCVFFLYLILYSIGRLFIEHIRLDSVLTLANWHIAQIVSVLIIVFSGFALFFLLKKTEGNSKI